MYCKKCGKEIAEDSFFCSYCGEKQLIEVPSTNINDEVSVNRIIDEVPDKNIPIEAESKANIVANEILANLKMIGLALLLSAIFIGIFWAYHIKDRKPLSENYFGYSCYDPSMMPVNLETDWEIILSYWKMDRLQYGFPNKSDEELTKDAQDAALGNKKIIEDEINYNRKERANKDLINHIKYSIIISLAFTIFGRYLIKGIKWVAVNKTY